MASPGRSCGLGGGRSGGDGDDSDEARKALVRSIGAKRRAARRWTNYGLRPPPSLAPYAGPSTPTRSAAAIRQPLAANHDDDEEREALAAAIRLSENALAEELRREREEMEAAIAAVEAAKRAEREAAIAAREAAIADVIVLDD